MNRLFKVVYVVSATITTLLLGRRIRCGDTGALDARITSAIQRQHRPWLDKLMQAVSWPGFPPQSRIIPWAVSGAMLAAGRPLEALFQLLGWGTGGISGAVKRIVRRPRPNSEDFKVAPARISGTSFPSGHVIIYTGVYGFLAYLAHCHVRIRVLRRAIVGGLTAMIALVGPSRVYLGHHWFSDVLASYLLGTSYLTSLAALYNRQRRKRSP